MKMKPFELEKAKAGAPLCTRDGRPARIVCWDVDNNSEGTILALRRNRYDEEVPELYNECGEYEAGSQSALDLFLASTKHEGWVNIYRHNYHGVISIYHTDRWIADTYEEAVKEGKRHPDYVATIEASWEE